MKDRLVVGANLDRRVASSHRQLLEGMRSVCEWNGLVLRFTQATPTAPWWKLEDPVPAGTLALGIVRSAAARADVADLRAALGYDLLHLTAAGETLLAGVRLGTAEAAVVLRLRRGVRAEEILALPGCGLRGYRFAWMLKVVGAAAPKRGGSYPLLLRKRREIRAHASAHALLDLPTNATDKEARRALRTLVRDLHPDRFSASASPALRRASGEIVSALVTAEAAIRTGASD
jgi:hypothetical protein